MDSDAAYNGSASGWTGDVISLTPKGCGLLSASNRRRWKPNRRPHPRRNQNQVAKRIHVKQSKRNSNPHPLDAMGLASPSGSAKPTEVMGFNFGITVFSTRPIQRRRSPHSSVHASLPLLFRENMMLYAVKPTHDIVVGPHFFFHSAIVFPRPINADETCEPYH